MPPIPGPGSYAPVVRIERHQIGGLQHTRCRRARTASPGQRSVAQRPAPRPVSQPISLSSAAPRTRFRMLALSPMRSQPSPLSAGGNGVCRPGTRRSGCGSMAPGGRPGIPGWVTTPGGGTWDCAVWQTSRPAACPGRAATSTPLTIRPRGPPGGSDEGSAASCGGVVTQGAQFPGTGVGAGSPGIEASKTVLARRPVRIWSRRGDHLAWSDRECSSLPRCRWM